MLVDWYVKVFKSVTNTVCILGLIINPLLCFSFFGKSFGSYYEFNAGMGFVGLLVGFIATFLFQLFTIPPLMILFSIHGRVEDINNKLSDNSESFYFTDENKKSGPEVISEPINETKEDTNGGFQLINKDNKTFTIVKGGNPDNYFCPDCYKQVNPNYSSCPHCNRKF